MGTVMMAPHMSGAPNGDGASWMVANPQDAFRVLSVSTILIVLVQFLTSVRLGACFWFFGREVAGSGIWGVQTTQRDALATMVVLVF